MFNTRTEYELELADGNVIKADSIYTDQNACATVINYIKGMQVVDTKEIYSPHAWTKITNKRVQL